MYRVYSIGSPDELQRFCAAAGHPLLPESVRRQAPDFSSFLEDAPGQAVARCSLWWKKTPEYRKDRVGYLGHYAVADAGAAPELLGNACERLAAEGCTIAIGPVDGNTWQRYRLVTERGSEPPFFLEPDNPDDWPGQFTAAGFTPLAQYYSALNADLVAEDARIPEMEQRVAGEGIIIEPLRLERFDEEMRQAHALSLISFRNNFLYTPIGEAEFLAQYALIRPHLRPDLVLLARRGEAMVGYVFAIPDLCQAQRGQPVNTAIIKTLAVHPDFSGHGLGSLLLARCQRAASAAGFSRAIHALFHEANRSGRISRHTASVIRRYTLFARKLGGQP